ncbi:Vps5 C terminal like-domain-containing protein [Flagelloscypha sp. PMI_526]|nr:Vps5 C terminal like-domain-containing protein [Flagelloscypha sp. PMI_526]
MNGFGDGENTLEDNPFANPFASSNSNSSNPWGSSYQDQFNDDFDSQAAFGGEGSTPFGREPSDSQDEPAEVPDTPVTAETPSKEPAEVDIKSDPLDSVALAKSDDEEEEALESAKSPGFREAGGDFSQTATIRPSAPEEYDPPRHSPSPPRIATPPLAAPAPTHTTSASVDQGWGNPLDRQPQSFNDSPYANLALGGETSTSGWHPHEESATWSNEPRTFSRFPTDDGTEDSDDDRPIGEILKKSPPVGSASSPKKGTSEPQPSFTISVDDPQKVGDPIRSFTMYTVHTKTTSTLYQKSAFSVLRRYSDFLWLYEILSLNNPGVVVPPVPEKNPFGRFDQAFVKQRRLALEKCVQKIANHPVLCHDADLRLFLESDTFALDIKSRKAEVANEKGGLIASIGQAVAGPKFYETDEWFDKQKFYLDSLESQLRGLVKSIELVAKHRSELAQATAEFAKSVSELSSSDVGRELSQSLAGLADVEESARDLQLIQSDQDMSTLMATADEYARLINSVRLAFTSRIRTYHAWRNSESEANRVKQSQERNRSQGRIPPERVSWSLSQIAEAERRALESKREFEDVSKLTKKEVARFERERIEDFKNTLHAFLEGMITRQKELIQCWENYQQMLLKKVGGGRGLPG